MIKARNGIDMRLAGNDKGEKWNKYLVVEAKWSLELDEFEAIIESGSDGVDGFFCGKMGLFLGDGLYSGAQWFDTYAIGEVPVLDVIVVNSDLVKLFWLAGEASCIDLVFANINGAFTSFEDVTCFNRVRIPILEKWISFKISNPGLEELLEITLRN